MGHLLWGSLWVRNQVFRSNNTNYRQWWYRHWGHWSWGKNHSQSQLWSWGIHPSLLKLWGSKTVKFWELYSLREDQVTLSLRESHTDQLGLLDLVQDTLALNGQHLLDVKTRSWEQAHWTMPLFKLWIGVTLPPLFLLFLLHSKLWPIHKLTLALKKYMFQIIPDGMKLWTALTEQVIGKPWRSRLQY